MNVHYLTFQALYFLISRTYSNTTKTLLLQKLLRYVTEQKSKNLTRVTYAIAENKKFFCIISNRTLECFSLHNFDIMLLVATTADKEKEIYFSSFHLYFHFFSFRVLLLIILLKQTYHTLLSSSFKRTPSIDAFRYIFFLLFIDGN